MQMNRSKNWLALFLGSIVGGLGLTACPQSYWDRCEGQVCEPGGGLEDSGKDGNVPDSVAPPDDSFALFVDGEGGSDSNDGSRAKPFKKISTAITRSESSGKNKIYICGSGTYPEHLKLTSAVNLHGGFACANWEADDKLRAKVSPTDKGYALHVDNVSEAVMVSDLELSAANAVADEAGTSSIAVFVNKATVNFLRVAISASNGADGAPGKAGDTGKITAVSSGTMDAVGNSGSGPSGGASKTCTCSSSSTVTKGGAGGSDTGGGGGEPNYGAGAAGQSGGNCLGNGKGGNGADAPPAQGAAKIATRGTLAGTGWLAAKGADATETGAPGQGGGGGGAANAGTGGSGGGCGGCGGFPGKGGGGAGASIALLIDESDVSLTGSSLVAKAGGTGGPGGAGGAGAAGGAHGVSGACEGGNGGRGGDGGGGSGGAGGLSVGILYKGTPPKKDEKTTIQPGTFGEGGKGGKDNDGPPGVRAEIQDAAKL